MGSVASVSRPWILGLSAAHNGGACLLRGNDIVVAIQEERLSGIKRDRTYGARPSLATEYCLRHAGLEARDLDMIVVCVQGEAQSIDHDVTLNPQLRPAFHGVPWLRISHHLGHAISAYAVSGFADAAVLVIDGMGSPAQDLSKAERSAVIGAPDGWEIISTYEAAGTTVRPVAKQLVPEARWLRQAGSGMPMFASIGGMYSAVAQQIFGDPMDAGKVMGLAPFGTASINSEEFVTVTDGVAEFGDVVPQAFRHRERWPRHEAEYADLAASVQAALEEAVLALASRIRSLSSSVHLCYAGGVALNCVVNERLRRESGFREVFIAPFAEDSGPAVGAAFYGLWQITGARARKRLVTDGLGHRYSGREVQDAIRSVASITVQRLPAETIEVVADRLCEGQVGGWFQGRSELGPRALGHRSILADPRRPELKKRLNREIKQREAFRPLAPSVLAEHVYEWFDIDDVNCHSPFMLRTIPFRAGLAAQVPAVSHVDNTARIQTVCKADEPNFYDLIRRFYERTNVPMLLNTSLNGSGQPIVETPRDALWTMLELGLDFMVVEGALVEPAPTFMSILDLVPVIAAQRYSVDVSLDGGMTLDDAGSSVLRFQAMTPWGVRRREVVGSSLAVLALIDGRANGREIHKRIRDETLQQPTGLIQILRALRRIGIINYQVTEETST